MLKTAEPAGETPDYIHVVPGGARDRARPRAWRPVVYAVLVYALFFVGYVMVNRHLPLTRCGDLSTPWDRRLPFVPAFIWPFCFTYVLVLLPVVLVRDARLMARGTMAFAVLVASSCLLFILIPVTVPRPAAIPPSLSGSLVAAMFAADRPVCGFPSLHVSASVLTVAILFRVRRRVGLIALPLAVATSVSTLFIKQHVILDVVGGVALALVVNLLLKDGRRGATRPG
jgi:membrane-associated phospholipid phosphatase